MLVRRALAAAPRLRAARRLLSTELADVSPALDLADGLDDDDDDAENPLASRFLAEAELFASGSRTALSKCGSTAALSSTASVRAYGVPSGTPAAAVRARYAPGPLASAFGKVGRAAAAPRPPTAPRRQSVKAGSPRATALNRRSVTAHHIGDPSAVAALRR